MSREALLEKIKKAEAAAASDVEAAEKEQVSARNKVPIDQDNLMKKARDSAVSKSQKEIDAAKSDVVRDVPFLGLYKSMLFVTCMPISVP